MAERPILFSAPLVRALLAGRKTETRRLVTKGTSLPINFWSSQIDGDGDGTGGPGGAGGFDDLDWAAHEIVRDDGSRAGQPCTDRCEGRDYCCMLVDGDPRGPGGFGCGQYLHVPGVGGETRQRVHARVQPGDLLWVRETWRAGADLDSVKPSEIPNVPIRFEAEGDLSSSHRWGKGRPSIFMPRWASRITLRVTEVRVERVQEITEAGAKAEGVERHMKTMSGINGGHRDAFAELWDEINGKREGASWDSNPWVWIYKFEVVP